MNLLSIRQTAKSMPMPDGKYSFRKLSKSLSPFDIILPKDAEVFPFRNNGHHPAMLQGIPIGFEITTPPFKIPSCPEDGLEVTHIPVAQQCLEGSHIIEPPPHSHHHLQLPVGQVLVKHGEVITEVQVGFHRIAFR